MKIVEETPYRFRIEQEGAMRVPGIVFASRSLLPRDEGDMALDASGQRGYAAGDCPGLVCDARCALGIWFPNRRRGRNHDVDNDGVVSQAVSASIFRAA